VVGSLAYGQQRGSTLISSAGSLASGTRTSNTISLVQQCPTFDVGHQQDILIADGSERELSIRVKNMPQFKVSYDAHDADANLFSFSYRSFVRRDSARIVLVRSLATARRTASYALGLESLMLESLRPMRRPVGGGRRHTSSGRRINHGHATAQGTPARSFPSRGHHDVARNTLRELHRAAQSDQVSCQPPPAGHPLGLAHVAPIDTPNSNLPLGLKKRRVVCVCVSVYATQTTMTQLCSPTIVAGEQWNDPVV
jgi:hypothetical protein